MNVRYRTLHGEGVRARDAAEININPTWDEVETATKSLVNLMLGDGFEPERIVGISRGGLIPAVVASQMMNIPLIPISYSSKTGAGDQRNHANVVPSIPGDILSGTGMGITKPKLLIIDDIADSGRTLAEVNNFYVGSGHEVRIIVMYFKESSVFMPDYTYYQIPEDAPFVNFPWER